MSLMENNPTEGTNLIYIARILQLEAELAKINQELAEERAKNLELLIARDISARKSRLVAIKSAPQEELVLARRACIVQELGLTPTSIAVAVAFGMALDSIAEKRSKDEIYRWIFKAVLAILLFVVWIS